LVLFATVATAQVKETINVSLVEVPVNVVDGSGNAVRGLKAENFKLYDNGKERPITAFDAIDLTAKGQTALSTISPAARRNFLLLFDLSFTSPRSMANAQEAARNFVKKGVQPLDRVAVATLDIEHGFKLLTSFTSDRDLIASVISNPAGFKSADPLQLSNETKLAKVDSSSDQWAEVQEVARGTAGVVGVPGELGGGQVSAWHQERARQQSNDVVEQGRQMSRANEGYLRARIERQVDLLGALARTLRYVPGRKQIVFLSEGFDGSIVTGREAGAQPEAKVDNEQALRGVVVRVDNDQRYGSTASQKFLNEMVKFCRGSDVVLHAIDIKGIRVQNSIEGSGLNSNAGLAVLSAPTGGMLFQNANDLSGSFDRMLKAQEVVYVLSFRAPVEKPGEFHDLRLKLVRVPGSPQLSYRSGYYEAGNESRDERMLTSAEIILNDVPQEGLKVDAFTAAFPTNTTHAQVPVILEILGGDLVGAARSNAPAVEVFIYAFDEGGVVRDRLFQRLSLDLGKLRERLYDAGLKYYATLSLPPGKYAIRSLIRVAESDRKGYARSDVVVPEQGAVAMLPPVFIDTVSNWVMIKGATHSGEARYPFHLDNTEFIPAATARIRSGETPQFAVFVQNAQPDEVTIDTTPRAKFVGATHGEGTSAFLMQIDDVLPSVATIDVTLHRKGMDGVQKASVRVEP
jgi:VWFA-related protein